MAGMKYFYEVTVSSSPHVRASESTRTIMLDVCIALVPALVGGVLAFGWYALLMTVVSAGACAFFEWGYRKLMKLDCTVDDCSAVVTGILIAFVCPPSLPLWMVILADAFAILVVKQLFGGIGQNIVNPALAGRALLLVSFPIAMTNWAYNGGFGVFPDAVSGATPLGMLREGKMFDLLELFVGKAGGCVGEVSALLLLIGGVYLLARRIISWHIPVSFIATVAVLTFLFPQHGADRLQWMTAQLLSGGLMIGAFFMATDMVTSPVTKLGKLIFGIGCGVITVAIRYFGSYPEGVSFAILIMNTCVGILDRVGRPKQFGSVKKEAAK